MVSFIANNSYFFNWLQIKKLTGYQTFIFEQFPLYLNTFEFVDKKYSYFYRYNY